MCKTAQESVKKIKTLKTVPCICRQENNETFCTEPEGISCNFLESLNIKVNVTKSSDLTVILDNFYENLKNETHLGAFLDLSANSLTEIDFRVLFQFTNLIALNLSDNHLKAFENTDNLLNNNKKLRDVDLSYNHITKVDFKDFDTSDHTLQTLDLSYNQIRLLWGALRVYSINLRNNNLQTITNDFFQNVTNLQELDLQYNNLYNIEHQGFKNLIDLKILKASHNNLNELHPQTFNMSTKLTDLELQFNNLSELNDGLFDSFYNLKALNVSYNNLQMVNNHMFHTATQLESLDISHNIISIIFRNTFVSPKLKFLAINDNQLEILDIENTLKYTKNLNMFLLDNNQFDCKTLLGILKECHKNQIFVKPREHFNESDYFPIECIDVDSQSYGRFVYSIFIILWVAAVLFPLIANLHEPNYLKNL